ncbi:CmpA/NrtA family ABC transporter substrate-binding protein [Mesorhizobium sp. VK24D]|uniref:CmpA/NrtA family ABC transporter substrate-binding protein n=1 Tax=Mesorhizobium album TaxID=3072314 RepID=A0ABU4XY09_9HYPH|nr:CmpA/NrtA family ABC transporter substrate-binding protein [Mesorhizobium sp. VK24D]MDX8479575.1 CmpA/NrtA family ABC transporter substrate-binding protein [Mesorhizobium sp. VK24D]
MEAMHEITAGFMPLFDSAVLVAAGEMGFAAREGIELKLHRETSWANIRDRIAIGHFDVAHMLGPMPLACSLGLTPLASETIVPFSLGLGGNCVTVSNPVWEGMAANGASPDLDPARAGAALGALIRERAAAGRREPLRFAVVHPHSGHNYELRYWLAACGIDPDRDIEIVIVPPPFMTDALAAGRIDGYCVGEPWNSAAVAAGTGHIVTLKALLWRNSPEKVIGVRKVWAEDNPDALAALLRALHRSARWCQDPANRGELAALMARPAFLGQQEAIQMPALTGRLQLGGGAERSVEDFFLPFDKAANFPWKSHALWFYTQMVRWGQLPHTPQNLAIARDCYRPDLYRSALKPLGVALPGANAKVEGALKTATPVGSAGASLVLGPDGFFDGQIFDPDRIDAYITGQNSGEIQA